MSELQQRKDTDMVTFFLSSAQIASVASLAAAASSEKLTPILSAVKISVTPSTVTAIASDRYVAARLTFPLGDTVHTIPEDGAIFLMSVEALAALAKTKAGYMLTSEGDDTPAVRVTAESDAGDTFTFQAPFGNFPPIERLIPAEDPDSDIPAGIRITARHLAQLAKLRLPGEKPAEAANSGYAIGYPGGRSQHAQSPLVASRSAGEGELLVLLQPHHR